MLYLLVDESEAFGLFFDLKKFKDEMTATLNFCYSLDILLFWITLYSFFAFKASDSVEIP